MALDLYERVAAYGPSSLSDQELLRVLLRAGNGSISLVATTQAILQAYPRLNGLGTVDVASLIALPGIGLSKAVGLVASLEFGRRVVAQEAARFGTVVSSTALGERLIRQWRGIAQEQVLVMLVDSQLQVISESIVARGGRDSAPLDPRIVFASALRQNASGLFLAHNHPSGVVTPSAADRATTERFVQGGALLGIVVHDHLIIGTHDYYSFAQADQLSYFK